MIYSYQQSVYEALKRTAVAHQLSAKAPLPVKPRFHRLIVGPTGVGKSHIAEQIGKDMNWACMSINVSGWIVLGARETPTWHVIVNWLADGDKPKMIVLDELDKVYGEDSWTRYLRAELFSLMDGKIPMNEMSIECSDGESPAAKMNKAEENLKKLLVIGCGAFQHIFDEPPTLGFGEQKKEKQKASKLAKSLQRELVNRFDANLLVLPALTKSDYRGMLDELEPHLPADAYEIVRRIGSTQIEEAVENQSAARFGENLLAAAFYELTKDHPVEPHPPEVVPVVDPAAHSMPTQAEIDAAAAEAEMWDVPVPVDAGEQSGSAGVLPA